MAPEGGASAGRPLDAVVHGHRPHRPDLPAGVRTRGSAGGGRQEWYGATDIHRLSTLHAQWGGVDLGRLAPVDPPVSFGFGSTLASPCVVEVVTTISMAPNPS